MKKQILLIVFLLSIISCFSQSWQYYYDKAINCNDPTEAITYWNKVIAMLPSFSKDRISAYINRGCMYGELKDSENAINDFDKALSLNPDNIDALYNRGRFLVVMEKYNEALEDLNKAINLDNNSGDIYSVRGFAFLKLKKYDNAINDFNKAIKISKKDNDSYFNRGTLYFEQHKYDEALKDFIKASKIKPNDEEAYTQIGIIYLIKQNYREANMYFEKSIKKLNNKHSIKNKDKDYYLDIFVLYFATEKYKDAYEILGKIKELKLDRKDSIQCLFMEILINTKLDKDYSEQLNKIYSEINKGIEINWNFDFFDLWIERKIADNKKAFIKDLTEKLKALKKKD